MKKTIALTVAIIMAFTGLAMAQSAYDEYKIRTRGERTSTSSASTASVPSGAVMAFDLRGKCPSGWSQWDKASGRVIIGTGTRDGENYKNYQIGGTAKTTVSADNISKGKTEMNSMSVKVRENQSPPFVAVADTSVVSKECINQEKHCTRYPTRPYTISIGRDDAEELDIRQPFIALTYCRKN